MGWNFWKLRTMRLNKTPILLDEIGIVNNGVSSNVGKGITENKTLRLSVVWACINLRSRIIGSMPCSLRNADKTIDNLNPLHTVLHRQPNRYMSASDFWSALSVNLDLTGNAYIRVQKSVVDGEVLSLRIIPSHKMSVFITPDGIVYREYSYRDGKDKYTDYDFSEIIHIRNFSKDGLIGLNPIEWQADTFGSLLSANKSADYAFANSLKAGGFIETADRILQPKQREQLREQLENFADPRNAGKFIVLEAGQKVSTVKPVLSATDSQLLQSRYFGIEEICRIFGVPPQLIGHNDKSSSWASSLEAVNQQFLTYSIDPVLVKIEQALEIALLGGKDKFIKFNRSSLLRANTATRAQFYSQMVQNGIYTRNECRDLEDMTSVSQQMADDLTIQLNLTTDLRSGDEV